MVWGCKYQPMCTTKYRYEVPGGDVGLRCRELLREIARSKEMLIYTGSINRDHVHMLIRIPPQLSVSKAVQYLEGQEFAPVVERVCGVEEPLLGLVSVGDALLHCE